MEDVEFPPPTIQMNPVLPVPEPGLPCACNHLPTLSGHTELESVQNFRPCPHETLWMPHSCLYTSNCLSPFNLLWSLLLVFPRKIHPLLPNAKIFFILHFDSDIKMQNKQCDSTRSNKDKKVVSTQNKDISNTLSYLARDLVISPPALHSNQG